MFLFIADFRYAGDVKQIKGQNPQLQMYPASKKPPADQDINVGIGRYDAWRENEFWQVVFTALQYICNKAKDQNQSKLRIEKDKVS